MRVKKVVSWENRRLNKNMYKYKLQTGGFGRRDGISSDSQHETIEMCTIEMRREVGVVVCNQLRPLGLWGRSM